MLCSVVTINIYSYKLKQIGLRIDIIVNKVYGYGGNNNIHIFGHFVELLFMESALVDEYSLFRRLLDIYLDHRQNLIWNANRTVTAAAQVLARPYAIFLSMFLPGDLSISIDLSTHCQSRPIHHSLARLALRVQCYSIILRDLSSLL